MKRISYRIVLMISLCLSSANAESLSRADLEELLLRLEKITETASTQLDQKYKNAIDAFTKGMQSDSAAIELYLACIEKAEFSEKQKTGQEFRDWKRAQEEKQKDPHFRAALRHQLNWLCLTLRANIRPEKKEELRPEVLKSLADLLNNAEKLTGQFETLQQPVGNTVFHKAYELGDLHATEWPDSPLKVAEIFDTILMPQIRSKKDYKELSSLWDKRISLEQMKVAIRDKKDKPSGLSRSDTVSPMIANFRENALPQLTWEKYMDLFKAGDEKGTAVAMLHHIATHIKNPRAKSWADEFKSLITPGS